MASNLVPGKYKLSTSQHVDEFLKEMGVKLVRRQAIIGVKPEITITKVGDVYTMKTFRGFETSEISFKLGEEFDEEREDGLQVKSIITADGNKLVHIKKGGDMDVKIELLFYSDGFIANANMNYIVSSQVYERL